MAAEILTGYDHRGRLEEETAAGDRVCVYGRSEEEECRGGGRRRKKRVLKRRNGGDGKEAWRKRRKEGNWMGSVKEGFENKSEEIKKDLLSVYLT